jgi:hypothetical protein
MLNTIGFRPSLQPNPASHPDVEFKMSDILASFRIRCPTSKQIEFGRLLQSNNRVPINSVHCLGMFVGHAGRSQRLTSWEELLSGKYTENCSVNEQCSRDQSNPCIKLTVADWLQLFFNCLLRGKQLADQPEHKGLFNLIFLKYHGFS